MKLNSDPVGSFFKRVDAHVEKLKQWHKHFAILVRVGPGDWRFLETVERRRIEKAHLVGKRLVGRVVTEYREVKA